jgi:hypothetical protein
MNIDIIPTGGLCNRMRAMGSGIEIAKAYDAHVRVYWNNTKGLGADFSQLFNTIQDEKVEIIENHDYLHRVENKRTYLMHWPLLRAKYDQVIFNYGASGQKDDIYKFIHADTTQKLLLTSCYAMCEKYDLKSLFVPIDDLQKEIDRTSDAFSDNTIGIHIRRTDNKDSIKFSPMEAFEKQMIEELRRNADTKFYLASDDNNVKHHLMQLFPDKIITQFEDTSRSSLDGMRFAIVDLYSLSRTKHIIGSYYSSFSHIASLLGGINVKYAMNGLNK